MEKDHDQGTAQFWFHPRTKVNNVARLLKVWIVMKIHVQVIKFLIKVDNNKTLIFIFLKHISIFKNILELQIAEKLVKSLTRNGK